MAEFIYSMVRPQSGGVGDKLILDDVTMSFFPRQDRCRGTERCGKSTILKIMAGLDIIAVERRSGASALSFGYTVGILMVEPELDEHQDQSRERRRASARPRRSTV
jgi:ATPase subunit of ABC transporter with duplicated ATPase domains